MRSNASDTNLENDKLEIIKWVAGLDDDSSIERIKLLKDKKHLDWWDEISNSEKDALNAGLKDLRNRNTKPHQQVKKIYEKWL